MATLFSDDFNRSNGGMGSNWLEPQANGWSISGNEVASSGAILQQLTTTNAHAATADCKVSCKRTTSNWDGGPCVRAAGGSYYYLDFYNSDSVEIYRRNIGSDTFVGGVSSTHASGDTYTLEVSGTGATVTLKAYRNGALVLSTTDVSGSRITAAGQTGMVAWDANGRYDDFLVEDLTSGASAALSGASTSGALGALAPSVSMALSGLAAAGAPGAPAPSQGGSVVATGAAATAVLGGLAASTVVTLIGQSATGSVGALWLGAGAAQALSGQAAASALGALSAGPAAGLAGVSGAVQSGATASSLSRGLAGASIAASQGALGKALTVAPMPVMAGGQPGALFAGVAGGAYAVQLTGISLEGRLEALGVEGGGWTAVPVPPADWSAQLVGSGAWTRAAGSLEHWT